MKKFIAMVLVIFTILAAYPSVVFAETDSNVKVRRNELQVITVEHAVDLREYLPNAVFDMVLCTSNNFVGHQLYPAVPILEEKTAEMLKAAAEIFAKDGYAIKIYDAYRPMSAQKEMWAVVHDASYVADPNNWGSWHQRGRAVDMSLVDMETGEELAMPTEMHSFSTLAGRRGYSRDEWSEEVCNNVDYMTEVMRSVGFKTIQTEWWHFENTARGNCLPTDLDLRVVSTAIH